MSALLPGEPAIDRLHARITEKLVSLVDMNDPRTANGGDESQHTKPESREPGRQQCAGAIRKAERILDKAARDIEAAYDSAKVRDSASIAPDSIGGVETDLVDGAPSVYSAAEVGTVRGFKAERRRLIAERKNGVAHISVETS